MGIVLRPYQSYLLDQARTALRQHRSVLIQAPCGAGKGSCISVMVAGAVARKKRVIFAVHGVSLVTDQSRRLQRLNIPHGVLMGGKKREAWHAVQVASIDTLHRMAHKPSADLIILDEARTFLSSTGRQVVDDYPDARIVGMDATPARLDGKGLGTEAGGIFESLVMGPSEQELIDLGYLVPSIPIGIPDPPDVSGIRKTGGDFNQKQLSVTCDKVKLVGNIVEHWLRHAAGRKTIAFGVDQAHARHIADQFVAAGIEFAYIDASTPDAEREAIYERLDHGTLMGISNVMIAGVGWDHPIVSCVIAARPTASLTLWRQMMGRGSRIYPGKKDFLILDHASNVMRHFPYGFFETPPVWSLAGAETGNKAGATRAESIAMCKTPVPVPESGVPATFTGPVAHGYLLPSYHCFTPGPALCPYCGLPLLVNVRKVEVEDAELKDLTAIRENARTVAAEEVHAQHARKTEYFDLVKAQQQNNYKPGYPAIVFKNKFGYWPPRGWKEESRRIA